MASPPVRASRARSALSQRGRQVTRQAAVADDDVGGGAGAGQRFEIDQPVAPGGEQAPDRCRPCAARRRRNRRLQAAPGIRSSSTSSCIQRRGLGEEIADIVAGAAAQDGELAVGRPQGEMAAVAGDEQIGRRGRERPQRRRPRPAPGPSAASPSATGRSTGRRRPSARRRRSAGPATATHRAWRLPRRCARGRAAGRAPARPATRRARRGRPGRTARPAPRAA